MNPMEMKQNAAGSAERVLFTKEMKRDYTILIPTMLPVHFSLIVEMLKAHGYKAVLLSNDGPEVSECGLRYVHNDTCYPALLVIGQMIDALESGLYDKDKTALLITQTGGGCRASNYISLLRKALQKAGLSQIPVISFNVAGLEKNPGFSVTPGMYLRMFYAVLYGDLLMLLKNQCLPYERHKGATEALLAAWTERLSVQMRSRGYLSYRKLKQTCRQILREFDAIERGGEEKIRVGIVGEIFMKFSPLGNNRLEDFLLSEGAEVVMPGLLDFCLYCVYNGVIDHDLYGTGALKAWGSKKIFSFLTNRQKELIGMIREESSFRPMSSFAETPGLVKDTIGLGVKMGEGWLLTAEMLELIEQGVRNIVCAQPFGCLPNHIVAKGMMKPIKEKHPGVNIAAIDYDASASKINQENRIKLMLAEAMAQREAQAKQKAEQERAQTGAGGEKTPQPAVFPGQLEPEEQPEQRKGA